MTSALHFCTSTTAAVLVASQPIKGVERVHRVTLLPGGGAGAEATASAVRAVEATGVEVIWEKAPLDTKSLAFPDRAVPLAVVEAIKRNRVALRCWAAVADTDVEQRISRNLSRQLGLLTHFQPIGSFPEANPNLPNNLIDLAIFEENFEGLCSTVEGLAAMGIYDGLDFVSNSIALRIANAAFAFARRGRKARVTAIYQGTGGTERAFLSRCRETARVFQEIHYDELSAGEVMQQLSTQPEEFDVIVAPAFLGNSVANLGAVLAGGINLMPCADFGESCAVFSAVGISSCSDGGPNGANPTGAIRAAALLLKHVGEADAGHRLEQALYAVYARGDILTMDAGGRSSGTEFTDAVIAEIG
jgi:isocitrate dehydrogenase (NAD+)